MVLLVVNGNEKIAKDDHVTDFNIAHLSSDCIGFSGSCIDYSSSGGRCTGHDADLRCDNNNNTKNIILGGCSYVADNNRALAVPDAVLITLLQAGHIYGTIPIVELLVCRCSLAMTSIVVILEIHWRTQKKNRLETNIESYVTRVRLNVGHVRLRASVIDSPACKMLLPVYVDEKDVGNVTSIIALAVEVMT